MKGAMELIECSRCGSKDVFTEDRRVICAFCRSQFMLQADMYLQPETVVDVLSDIHVLLQKCKADPANSYRYASLILDIDPTNQDASHYLRKGTL